MSLSEACDRTAEPPLFTKVAAQVSAVLTVDGDMWARMRNVTPDEAMNDVGQVLREPGVTERLHVAIGAVIPGWIEASGSVVVTVDRVFTIAARPAEPGQSGPVVRPQPSEVPPVALVAAAIEEVHAIRHWVTAHVEQIRATIPPGTPMIDRFVAAHAVCSQLPPHLAAGVAADALNRLAEHHDDQRDGP